MTVDFSVGFIFERITTSSNNKASAQHKPQNNNPPGKQKLYSSNHQTYKTQDNTKPILDPELASLTSQSKKLDLIKERSNIHQFMVTYLIDSIKFYKKDLYRTYHPDTCKSNDIEFCRSMFGFLREIDRHQYLQCPIQKYNIATSINALSIIAPKHDCLTELKKIYQCINYTLDNNKPCDEIIYDSDTIGKESTLCDNEHLCNNS